MKSNITAKDSEIEGQQSSIKDMERTYNDPTSQAYNIYAQLISELGTARSNNNKSITELEANLGIATGQDKAHSILASTDGVLHYIVPLKQGMSLQQGQTVAEVSGKEKDYYVEAFVAASDISRVSLLLSRSCSGKETARPHRIGVESFHSSLSHPHSWQTPYPSPDRKCSIPHP